MTDRKLRPTTAWALSNMGHLIEVYPIRKRAVHGAVDLTGEPWSKCGDYMEVTKVNVFPVDGGPQLSDWK